MSPTGPGGPGGSLVIDASNQRQGGGLQVAHSVVDAVAGGAAGDAVLVCLVGSGLAASARAGGVAVVEVPDGRRARARRTVRPAWEAVTGARAVYVVFGTVPRRRSAVPVVVGVAYSNLFYPEVAFWSRERAATRWLRHLRDRLRLRALLRADGWIFETEALRRRAVAQHDLEPTRTAVVPPPVSPYVAHPVESPELRTRFADRPGLTVLLAASWHPNKNLVRVPAVAAALRRRGVDDVRFLLTLEPGSEGARQVGELAVAAGVEDAVEFVGRIPQESMGLALAGADAVLLLSELESFSNNVIEAFASGTPLVVSDRDWARSACADAALYVEPQDAEDVASALLRLREPEVGAMLVAAGEDVLAERYSSAQERMEDVVEFVDTIVALGPRRATR